MHALELRLKPSKIFLSLLLFMLSGALASIFCSFLPYYIKLPLGVVTLAYGIYLMWGWVFLRAPAALVALTCQTNALWLLRERCGRTHQAHLKGESTRSTWVSILCFQAVKKHSAVIFYDALDPLGYRRLLMRLKYATKRTAEHS